MKIVFVISWKGKILCLNHDRNVTGTLGCIGLNCGVDRINDFLTASRWREAVSRAKKKTKVNVL